MSDSLSRGRFVMSTGAVAAPVSGPLAARAAIETAGPGTILRRKFGRHPDMISALGVGGHHLGDCATVNEATAIVHEAIDAGLNFFDNAWEYNNHQSEDSSARLCAGVIASESFS